MARYVTAYHFTGPTLRDDRPLPAIGEWLTHEGPVVMCGSGLHASRNPLDALVYAPGPLLHRVKCADIVYEDNDKLVCHRRQIVASIDATDILHSFARWCAASVLRLWDAPPVVTAYLLWCDESLRDAARAAASAAARAAARDAARAAASAAARDAAWAASAAAWAASAAAWDAASAAAWAAAWDAARDIQREEFSRIVAVAFAEQP